MAKGKGKKAWRKKIDVQEVEAFIASEANEARRSAPAAASLPDDELFVADAAGDAALAARAAGAGRRQRADRAAALARPLRSELVLRELTGGVKPARDPAGPRPKGRNPLPEPRQVTKAKAAEKAAAAAAAAAEAGAGAAASASATKKLRWHKAQHKKRKGSLFGDAWDGSAAAAGQGEQEGEQPQDDDDDDDEKAWLRATERQAPKRRRAPAARLPSAVKPVMVDAPGCSINPDEQARQDAVAAVVAAERVKEIAKMLERQAPPADLLEGGGGVGGEREDELARLLSGGGGGRSESDDDDDGNLGEDGSGDEQQERGSGAAVNAPGTPDAASASAAKQLRAKTQKDRNREARRRAADAEVAQRRALKAQRRDLDALPELRAEIERQEEEQRRLTERRQADREDKRATLPPRLGKRRFVPEPPMAPDAEEARLGSLRAVTPCALVAVDRLRSLQHRGLIEPRRPAPGSRVGVRRRGKRSEYTVGARLDKASAAQAGVEELKRARIKLQRKAQRKGLMVPGVQAGPASSGGGGLLALPAAAGAAGGGGATRAAAAVW